MSSILARVFALMAISTAIGTAPALAADPRPMPVVLAPGLLIPLQAYDNPRIKKLFESRGYRFLPAQMPDSGSVESRADRLYDEIKRLVPTGPFHILGVSMGGVDARRAIQKYGLGSRVRSLTTLSTPHRGTPLTDFVEEGGTGSDALKDVQDALYDLKPSSMEAFNRRVKDDSRVLYFSFGFMIPEPVLINGASPVTWYAHRTIKKYTGEDNDSMVGIGSARWGTYLGTMEGDHISISIDHRYRGRFIYKTTYDRVLDNLKRVDGAVSR
jgi:triacylglycerol lipase